MSKKRNISLLISEIKEAEEKSKLLKPDKGIKNKLYEYIKKICDIGSDYETIYIYFEPEGPDGRTFEEEIDFYLEKRNKGCNYNPEFIYPKLDLVSRLKLKNDYAILCSIELNLKKEKNEILRRVILEIVKVLKAKINILVELKKGNIKKAFKFAKDAYGDIDDNLSEEAIRWYNNKIKFLEEKKDKSDLEINLEKNKFNSKEIKYYFDLALNESEFRENKIETIIKGEEGSINVNFSDFEYCHPTIIIPKRREVNAIKLFELIAHEVGYHVLVNNNNINLGLGNFGIGKEWDVVSEGFAIINEINIKRKILGKLFVDYKIKSHAYPILVMKKINEGDNIGEIYDYIFDLKEKELLLSGYSKFISKKEAILFSKRILKRVYRGFYPLYFPKDKAYFEGEILAKIIIKEKLENYFLVSKIDINLLSDLIKLGIYSNCNNLNKNKKLYNIAEKVWNKNKKQFIKNIA